MLAARIDYALVLAYRDRAHREVFHFDVPENGAISPGSKLIARGDLVAAYVMVTPKVQGAVVAPYVEIVIVDVGGQLRFHERYPFAYDGWGSSEALVGREDGLFVVSSMEVKTGLGVVIDGATDSLFTAKMEARSDPDARGRLVVTDYEASNSTAFHFFDARKGTFTPSRYWATSLAGDYAGSPAVVNEALLYFERDPDRLVLEGADGVRSLPVPGVIAPGEYPSPGWRRSGGWALFLLGGSTSTTARYLATRFESGEVRTFTLAPPSPWQLPGDYWNPPPIDARGRLQVPLTDGARYQMFSTVDGATWEPVGLPVTAAPYAFPHEFVEAGGAVSFRGYGGGEKPLQGVLESHASQIVGPQGGEGRVLVRHDVPGAPDNPLYAEDTISGDGACVAYFKNGSVHIVETDGYDVSDLELTVDGYVAEMAWIPLARAR
jgi:hypothetical protein